MDFEFGGGFKGKNICRGLPVPVVDSKNLSILRVNLVEFLEILSLVGVFKAKAFAGDYRFLWLNTFGTSF